MSFLNEQDQEFDFGFADFGFGDAAEPSAQTQVIQDSNSQLQFLPVAPAPAPAPVSAPAILVQANDETASADDWENPNPSHRFSPYGPFNFSPIIPQGTSSHPESVKRRKIIGKKLGLAAGLFRAKESGRSRKRHRKDAIKKTKAYEKADSAEKERLLAEADKTSARELEATIAACIEAWNKLSPEAKQELMAVKPAPDAEVVAAPQIVEAEVVRPIVVRTGATNVPRTAAVGGPRVVPVDLKTGSRGPQLWLPVDMRDVDSGLIASARAKAMPFASVTAGRKRSAAEMGSTAPISPSRVVACADEIPVEAPLPRKRKCDAETVESQTPGRSCRPHKAPKLSEKRAANAIRYIMRSMAGKAGATGTVIPPGPLEQLRDQDLNAEAEWDAAQFMKHPTFKKWAQARKNKKH
ncbi:hypothetical protein TWF192_004578 [Orbilia oligospora]|nr:hypothetical protein TWF192_004578 [Orbilia oligospora]